MSLVLPGDDFFNAIAGAVDSQTKNRKKNLKRKERTDKRKADAPDEPPAKKAKTKSNIITTSQEQLKELETIFHSTSIYNSALDIAGVFTAIDNSPNYYYFYPLVLGPLRDKAGNAIKRTKEKGKPFKKAKEYIPAAGNPTLIFTTLNRVFTKLFPDKDPNLIRKWDVYRWNMEYYGPKLAGHAPDSKTYLAMLGNSRPLGGTGPSRSVHLVRDIHVSRFDRAIHVEEFFKGRKSKNLHAAVPETATVAPVSVLKEIETRLKDQKQSEAEAEMVVKKSVSTEDFATKAESDSEGEYSSESE